MGVRFASERATRRGGGVAGAVAGAGAGAGAMLVYTRTFFLGDMIRSADGDQAATSTAVVISRRHI